jgi:hypothetical protein
MGHPVYWTNLPFSNIAVTLHEKALSALWLSADIKNPVCLAETDDDHKMANAIRNFFVFILS